MPNSSHHSISIVSKSLSAAAFAVPLITALIVAGPQAAQAQTYTVLHSFNLLGTDGARPNAGLTADRAGNLYGTAAAGGPHHAGEVFRMKKQGQSWILDPIYAFSDGSDGAEPQEEVTFGPDGALYGNNNQGGQFGGGTIFKVQPPARAVGFALGGWTETSLYQFAFDQNRYGSPLSFDSAGNLYGSTAHWSGSDAGAIYQLTRNGNDWNVNVIYQFSGGGDGRNPLGSLAIDSAGNIYGVTDDEGPYDYGLVYELSPSPSGWIKTTLYAFRGGDDGYVPFGGLIFDHAGNLLGSTGSGGSGGGGTVFQLTPQAGRGWVFTTLYGFPGQSSEGPIGTLTVDAAGNIYGARNDNGVLGNNGSIFKLSFSGGTWNYTNLHSFAGGTDGDLPNGSLVVDANGNVYGTAGDGGAYNYGLVFAIAP